MRYGSVCSGIEAASAAWHPLGWKPQWFSEIEAFPSAVLKHHYPEVHNYGDFTKIPGNAADIDVLIGGTPCQSFSIAGLRGGLDDDRGNLALEFCRLADRLRPRWFVWENVPGVLSSNGGRDFGSILGAMGELGYGTAYRVLDAQYFGVPQRRRRVFVVGYLGDWRRAAAVLFERHSLSGDTPPRRKAGKGLTHELAPSLTSSGRGVERAGDSRGQDCVIPIEPIPFDTTQITSPTYRSNNKPGDMCHTLSAGSHPPAIASTGQISHCLNAGGMGRIDYETETLVVGALPTHHTPNGYGMAGVNSQAVEAAGHIVPICFTNQMGDDSGDMSSTLKSGCHGAHPMVALSLAIRGRDGIPTAELGDEVANAILTPNGGRGGVGAGAMMQGSAVRRLTPLECERLQGFPDGYTAVPYRGKIAADGPRYKALGNSMAVPCMKWLAERIQIVNSSEFYGIAPA